MTASRRRIILLKGDIFDPVQVIFHLPMLPTGLQEVCGRPWGAAQVVNRFLERLLVSLSGSMHSPHNGEVGPFCLSCGTGGKHLGVPLNVAAMGFIDFSGFAVRGNCGGDDLNGGRGMGAILLHGQSVVVLGLNKGAGRSRGRV
jgi:hypothetical protein